MTQVLRGVALLAVQALVFFAWALSMAPNMLWRCPHAVRDTGRTRPDNENKRLIATSMTPPQT